MPLALKAKMDMINEENKEVRRTSTHENILDS